MSTPSYLTRDQWEREERDRIAQIKQQQRELDERRDRILERESEVYQGALEAAGDDYEQSEDAFLDHMDHVRYYQRKYGGPIDALTQASDDRISTMTELYDQLDDLEEAERQAATAVQNQREVIAARLTELGYSTAKDEDH